MQVFNVVVTAGLLWLPLGHVVAQEVGEEKSAAPVKHAQPVAHSDVKAQSQPRMEEVWVTALKLPKDQAHYSGSSSVVNAAEMERLGVASIVEIGSIVPGLFTQENGARNPTPIVMRGINFEGMSSNDLGGDGGTVATYVNDIPLQGYYTPPQFVLKDLQTVEVLRGPQGTLYGAAALAGLIRYQSASPVIDELSLGLHSKVSQTQHSDSLNYDNTAIANIPVIENNLAVRVLLSRTDSAGFINNDELIAGNKKDINDEVIDAARLSLLYQPASTTHVSLMVHRQKTNVGDLQADNLAYTGKKYYASHSYLQPMQGKLNTASLSLNHDFSRHQLVVSANHYQYKQEQTTDLTNLYRYWYEYPASNSAVSKSVVDVEQSSIEMRALSQWHQTLSGVAGVFVSRNDLEAHIDEELTAVDMGVSATEYSANQHQTLKDTAIFTELEWLASDAVELNFGGRFFRYKDIAESCQSFAGDPLNCFKQSGSDNHVSAKLASLFKVHATTKIYGSVSEGFRRGGANPGIPQELALHRTYEPDTTLNYELGANSHFFDQRLSISAALFYIDWSNIQLSTYQLAPDSGNYVQYITNAKDAQSKGVEFEFTAKLAPWLKVQGSYAYTNASLSEDAPSYNDADGFGDNGYDGDRLPGTPKTQIHTSLIFEKTFSTLVVDANLSGHYFGAVTTQLNNEHVGYTSLKGYSLLRGRLGVGAKRWRGGFFVNNILNKRAVTGAQGDTYYGPKGAFEYVVTPRTTGFDVSYRF